MTEPMKIYLEELDGIPVLTKEDEKKFTDLVKKKEICLVKTNYRKDV